MSADMCMPVAAEIYFTSAPSASTQQPAAVEQQILKLNTVVQLMNHLMTHKAQLRKTTPRVSKAMAAAILTEKKVLASANECARQLNETPFTSVEQLDEEGWLSRTQPWPEPSAEQWESIQNTAKRVCIMWEWFDSKTSSTAAAASSSKLMFGIFQLLTALLEGNLTSFHIFDVLSSFDALFDFVATCA